MSLYKIKFLLLSVFLMSMAGLADAKGFLHASKVWQNGDFILREVLNTAGSFVCSVSIYIFTLRYLEKAGIVATELQVIFWFTMTVVSVSLMSGRFFQWQPLEQIVALLVVIGIGFLMVRT